MSRLSNESAPAVVVTDIRTLELSVVLPCLNEAETLEVCVRKALASLAELGVDATPMTPPGFGKFVADEKAKWAKVIQAANLKPE